MQFNYPLGGHDLFLLVSFYGFLSYTDGHNDGKAEGKVEGKAEERLSIAKNLKEIGISSKDIFVNGKN